MLLASGGAPTFCCCAIAGIASTARNAAIRSEIRTTPLHPSTSLCFSHDLLVAKTNDSAMPPPRFRQSDSADRRRPCDRVDSSRPPPADARASASDTGRGAVNLQRADLARCIGDFRLRKRRDRRSRAEYLELRSIFSSAPAGSSLRNASARRAGASPPPRLKRVVCGSRTAWVSACGRP